MLVTRNVHRGNGRLPGVERQAWNSQRDKRMYTPKLSEGEENKRKVEWIVAESFSICSAVLHVVATVLAWGFAIYSGNDSLAIVASVLITLAMAGLFSALSLGRCCVTLLERREDPKKKNKIKLRTFVFILVTFSFFPLILCCGILQCIAATLLTVSSGAEGLGIAAALFCLLSALVAPFVGTYGCKGLGRICPLSYE